MQVAFKTKMRQTSRWQRPYLVCVSGCGRRLPLSRKRARAVHRSNLHVGYHTPFVSPSLPLFLSFICFRPAHPVRWEPDSRRRVVDEDSPLPAPANVKLFQYFQPPVLLFYSFESTNNRFGFYSNIELHSWLCSKSFQQFEDGGIRNFTPEMSRLKNLW